MASLVERLFPVREVVHLIEVPATKAESGPGLFSLMGFPPLAELSSQPNKLMAEAELLFHRAPWVAAAERAIVGRLASVPYHLEDPDDNEITADTSPVAAALIDVLEHPQKTPKRTRRQLWSVTGRHMGLAGNAFWYLDQTEMLGGTPLSVMYINPVRMTPAEDEGGTLLGWIMDHPQNPLTPRGVQPTPFDLEEIIHFPLDEPDFGHFGVGIAETAHAKIELSRLVDRHASTTVGTGGRIAGIISPKSGGQPIGDDAWAAVIRDYRNIVGDPDSAKRVQVMRQPIDFTKTAADPTELQLPALGTASRDDILALWGVPLSQLGIVPARGLNSGETPKYEEAQLWQGPINDRLSIIREKVQTLIDRYQALGLTATIEFETPSFDDLQPLFDNAEKATTTPMTNNERRALVDLPPLEDEELGDQVYLIGTMTRIDQVPEPPTPIQLPPSTPQSGPPALSGEPGGPDAPDNSEELEPEVPVEAGVKAGTVDALRRRTEMKWEPKLRRAIRDVLSTQRDEVAIRVEDRHAHLVKRPKDLAGIWNSAKETQRLQAAVEPIILAMTREVAVEAAKKVPRRKALPASEAAAAAVPQAVDASYLQSVESFLRTRTGERIARITATKRDEIAKVIADGVDQGLSPLDLARTIREDPLFDEYAAERIARTEMMFAYNDAALSTYRELGTEYVEAIDGDQDEECAMRLLANPWTVEDAFSEVDHPNGTLDWVPVVSDAEILDALASEGA